MTEPERPTNNSRPNIGRYQPYPRSTTNTEVRRVQVSKDDVSSAHSNRTQQAGFDAAGVGDVSGYAGSGGPMRQPQEGRPSARRGLERSECQAHTSRTHRGARARSDRYAGRKAYVSGEAPAGTSSSTASANRERQTRAEARRPRSEFDTYVQKSLSAQKLVAAEGVKNTLGSAVDRVRSLSGGMKKALIVAVVAGLVIFGGTRAIAAMPITVKVDGKEISLAGAKDLATLHDEGYGADKAGNLIAVDGAVLKPGGGYPFTAEVNGQSFNDFHQPLPNGADIKLSRGGDIQEPTQELDRKTIPFETKERGAGPVHIISQEGKDGVQVTVKGEMSGKTETKDEQVMEPRIYDRRYVDTHGDKVVAFTFDDGPWDKQTEAVLDIAKQNNIKITLFTVGQLIKGDLAGKIKEAHNLGFEVASHTWDHAAGSGQGVNLGYMTTDERKAEIEKGQEAIRQACDGYCSNLMRAPGGNFGYKVWKDVEHLVKADIGWNVDTLDWKRPGVDAILKRMLSVQPGDIVLCHDGGGDRSQTIEAFRQAAPQLVEQGWKFMTVSELLEKYPLKDTKDKLKDPDTNK